MTMDIGLHLRVIWRFRLLILCGVTLASVLGVMSVADVRFVDGRPKLQYREPKVWLSSGQLLVGQSGFPLGRSTLTEILPGEPPTPRFSPPDRFVELAALYAQLATSDAVLTRMNPPTPFTAEALSTTSGRFPIIQFSASAPSPTLAQERVARAMSALSGYIAEEQRRSRIEERNRVQLAVVMQPRPATVISAPSSVVPIAVFFLVLGGVVLLAFVLENLRPEVSRTQAADPSEPSTPRVDRLSA